LRELTIMSETADPAPLTRHEIEARIARRAMRDEAFRAEFVADPVGTFVKYTNVPAAELPRIVVHEEEPGSWHIVLPAKPVASGELSEAELEQVAGGATPGAIVLSVAKIVTAGLVAGGVAYAQEESGW
jgi:hypothetical protein